MTPKIHNLYTLFLLIFLNLSPGFAQNITADFTVNTTQGCVPLSVNFQDLSTGPNITYRHWDFGNGNVSTGNNLTPQATYTVPGFYTVTLTISDGADTAVMQYAAMIEAQGFPTVDFDTNMFGPSCIPFPVQFNDLSVAFNSGVATWLWNFGDGTTSSIGPSVTHNYTMAGNYTVGLTVTDSNGCTAAYSQPSYINLANTLEADFSTSAPTSSCGQALTIPFVDATTGGSLPYTYFWDFNTGNISTAQNPTETFTNQGTYDVSLVVEDQNGCIDTMLVPNMVNVGTITADFSLPDTVCAGDSAYFGNLSTGATSYQWNFGDSTTSGAYDPSHIYQAGGNYSVQLIASFGSGCSDTLVQSIYVSEPVADFFTLDTFSCDTNYVVNYVNNSSADVTQFQYYFGGVTGGAISTQENPTMILNETGYISDTLFVFNDFGCIASTINTHHIHIVDPNIDILRSVDSGCVALDVQFTDNSTCTDSIIGWHYDFGTGDTSNLPDPLYTFQNIGEYPVVVTIETVSGCEYKDTIDIRVGQNNIPLFTLDTNVICGSDSIVPQNLSTDTNIIDDYLWLLEDGSSFEGFEPALSSDDTGYISISLIVNDFGCKDTFELDSAVYVSGPIMDLTYQVNCDQPLEVTINGDVAGWDSLYWDMGDSSFVINQDTFVHVYPQTGNYLIEGIAFNHFSGCTDTIETVVSIVESKACLNILDTVLCTPDIAQLDANCSQNVTHLFYYKNGQLINQGATSLYTDTIFTSGWTNYMLVSTDSIGCYDTAYKSVFSSSVQASFTHAPFNICSGDSVSFTNQSISDTTLTSYYWQFGNGGTDTATHPTHIYNSSVNSTYDVTLVATDTIGCKDTVKINGAVNLFSPDAGLFTLTPDLCEGDTAFFQNSQLNLNYSYLWLFGDGDSSTHHLGTHVYDSAGIYYAKVIMTDPQGCTDSVTNAYPVHVHDAYISGVVASPPDTTCYPANILFHDTTNHPEAATWFWDFNYPSTVITSSSDSVYGYYNAPGLYPVRVIMETTYQCRDTFDLPYFVDISGPVLNIELIDEYACYGEPFYFLIDSVPSSVEWFVDFGDGVFSDSLTVDSMLAHEFYQTGTISAFLSYKDTVTQCEQSDEVSFLVDRVEAQIMSMDTAFCEDELKQLVSQSYGHTQLQWVLNDEDIGDSAVIDYLFEEFGMGTLELFIEDSITGCKDSALLEIEIYEKPELESDGDTLICLGDEAFYSASGEGDLSFISEEGALLSSLSEFSITPDTSLAIIARAIDSNQCISYDTNNLVVQFPVQLEEFPTDTMLFYGQSYPTFIAFDTTAYFNWYSPLGWVACDTCFENVMHTDSSTQFILTYTDTNECFVYDSILNIDIEHALNVFIPNTFTPNSDGKNDEYVPYYFGYKDLISFNIYNRWGQLLFSTEEENKGWDGSFQDKHCVQDVYVYQLNLLTFDDKEEQFIGKVLLLR